MQEGLAMSGQKTQQSPRAKPRFFYGYIVVIAAFFFIMVMQGAHIAFGVFFKPVLSDFGWTRAMTSGAFSLSMVVSALLGIVTGGLTDKAGPRIVLSFCGILFGLGFLLMSQISAVWQLYLFYGVIIGAGISGAWNPIMSTIARWFTNRRSLMTGIVQTGVGIGGMSISLVATQLILAYDWRASYIILGSIVLVVSVLTAQFLRRDPAQMGQVPYGKNQGEQRSKSETEALSLREAVCTRQFWFAFGIEFCFGVSAFAMLVHIVPHSIELGFSPASAAGILATMNGASIAGRLVLGGAGDRIGNKQVFIIGFALMSAALFWLVPAREMWKLSLFAVVFGFGWGGCAASESPLAAKLFGLNSHGLIFGVLIMGYKIGAAIGPLLFGYIFDVTGSYQIAFLGGAAITILGLIVAATLRPIKIPENKT